MLAESVTQATSFKKTKSKKKLFKTGTRKHPTYKSDWKHFTCFESFKNPFLSTELGINFEHIWLKVSCLLIVSKDKLLCLIFIKQQ